MAEKVFRANSQDPDMVAAFEKARQTFKYFWRELSWDYRRIVPALDRTSVKVVFTQKVKRAKKPLVEYMWINHINFDGEKITGVLINEPNKLTNVHEGDYVEIMPDEVCDWLFAANKRAHGGFTIQAIRTELSTKERAKHDKAWGLKFGRYNDILLVCDQKKYPEYLEEHPLSKIMKKKLVSFIKKNPQAIHIKDEAGNTALHREAIAGNKTYVEVLKAAGAKTGARNKYGKTALHYARQFNWEHIIPLLEK
jgi:uncharacterized protein YegJ (DUF2314 family)